MPTPSAPTKNGQLSEVARHVVLPAGIVSTGWPAVRDKCAGFGVQFDPWQDGAGRAILAKRADGQYAASVGGVVISIPRQVAKTFLTGAIVFALCMIYPGLTVIWTAHRLRTATETFASMRAFARRKKIKPHVKNIVLGSGDEAVEFHNGSRILFGARERGFGRGFTNVGVLVFDEAQILTENAIDDMVPAMNQAANPLLFFLGTPPKPSDPGEVFARKRAEALAGDSDDTLYIEFSADRGSDPMDRKQWAKANPSYPHRTPESAMLRMRKNLSLDSFVREALGVWEEQAGVFPPGSWERTQDRMSALGENPLVLAWDVAPDGSQATVVFAGRRPDERWHVEVLEDGSAPGTDWVAERVALAAQRAGSRLLGLAVAGSSPAAALLPEIKQALAKADIPVRASKSDSGLPVVELSGPQYGQACVSFFNAVKDGRIKQLGQHELNLAAGYAKRRTVGDVWVWDRKQWTRDITPLCAATVAVRAFELMPQPEPLFAY